MQAAGCPRLTLAVSAVRRRALTSSGFRGRGASSVVWAGCHPASGGTAGGARELRCNSYPPSWIVFSART